MARAYPLTSLAVGWATGALPILGSLQLRSGRATLHPLTREIIADRGDWTNVVSVEDTVEQRVAGMAQTEVDPARGLTFARALARSGVIENDELHPGLGPRPLMS